MGKTLRLLGIVFLIVGLAMLAGVAVLVAGDYEKMSKAERAEGVVIAAPDNGKPIVEFRTRTGQRIRVEGSISASPSPYDRGERIGVFYDPADPQDAVIDSFLERWFVPLLLGGFAVAFTVIGSAFVFGARRRRNRTRHLVSSGQRIEGRIAGFEQNSFAKINSKRPWHVLVDWTDAKGETHRSRSEMMREDPSTRFRIGDRMMVFADPLDASNFWIDLAGTVASPGTAVASSFGGATTSSFGSTTTSSFGKAGNPVVRRR